MIPHIVSYIRIYLESDLTVVSLFRFFLQLRIAPAMKVFNNLLRQTVDASKDTVTVGNMNDFVANKMPHTYEQLRNRRKYMLKKQQGKKNVCQCMIAHHILLCHIYSVCCITFMYVVSHSVSHVSLQRM